MFDTEEFIIAVFCCIDDLLQEITPNRGQIRQRGLAPSLSDSEIITMEIVGEFRGLDTDKGIWQYFRDHWLKLFPKMKCRSTFVRQAANLWGYKQLRPQRLAQALGAFRDRLHLIDLMGFPFPEAVSPVGIAVVCFPRNQTTVTARLKTRATMVFGDI